MMMMMMIIIIIIISNMVQAIPGLFNHFWCQSLLQLFLGQLTLLLLVGMYCSQFLQIKMSHELMTKNTRTHVYADIFRMCVF